MIRIVSLLAINGVSVSHRIDFQNTFKCYKWFSPYCILNVFISEKLHQFDGSKHCRTGDALDSIDIASKQNQVYTYMREHPNARIEILHAEALCC